ncbi:unnamed protein product [Calypogeia fissa]
MEAEQSRSEVVLAQLAEGTAWFEFVETLEFDPSTVPFASLSSAFSRVHKKKTVSPCFARIGGARQAPDARSPALKKVEHFTIRQVAGDGRCMFRALVLGMAANKGASLNSFEEEQEADQLRLAVMDAICRGEKRQRYEEALIAITVEESIDRYCERIPSSRFWGGESELLVLSRMCNLPIIVYIPESEARRGRAGGGYLPIAEYGSEFRQAREGKKARKPVRLLYSGSNHYDLLV